MNSKATVRQSNFELLRILCMLGVVTGHVLLFLFQDQIHSLDWSLTNQCRVFLLNACAVAVNCFVMISGYFTIRFSWSRVLRFVTLCLWYAILVYLVFGGSRLQMIFPVSETGLWFVPCYLALMLISPLLNAGLDSLKQKELRMAVSLILFTDVYLGYWHQCEGIGVDGYGIFHLITMYCLGNLVARENLQLRHAGIWVIVCLFVMTILHALKMVWSPIVVLYSLHYNAPLLVLASVLVFLWAKGLKIQSKAINWVAASVFSVYLVFSNPSVVPVFHDWQHYAQTVSASSLLTPVFLAGLILLCFCSCILIDKLRIWVFNIVENLCLHH